VTPAPEPLQTILGEMRAAGGRVTTSRRAIVEVLLDSRDHHLTAEEIVVAVRARLPDVAESTIYRTLTVLEHLGVVGHVHLGHGPATFHLSDQPHRHLVCTRCQAVIEIPAELLAELHGAIETQYGFSVDEHFALTGLCRACRES
jgi:Fur family ferric uptake transcriptional regulator